MNPKRNHEPNSSIYSTSIPTVLPLQTPGGVMRSIGGIALEWELQVGDVIISPSRNNIYTIIGELPGIPSDGITKVLIIHSSVGGGTFKHEIPRGRSINYPFVSDGIYTGWGW
jgi:hypothetical protein